MLQNRNYANYSIERYLFDWLYYSWPHYQQTIETEIKGWNIEFRIKEINKMPNLQLLGWRSVYCIKWWRYLEWGEQGIHNNDWYYWCY